MRGAILTERKSGWLLACGIAVLLLGAAPGAGAGSKLAGHPLREALEELRRQGLNLLYSSAVVGPDLIVTAEPRADAPRAILDEILPPLGLAAMNGPGSTVLVVRAPPGRVPRFVEQIVVTPGRRRIVQEEPAPQRTIDQDDALLVPVIGRDVSRVVELLPGVTAPDNSTAFHVRGSAARDASFILDGLELYEPFHLESFQSPFSFIDSAIVERIDFLGGGFTADLGDRHGAFVEVSTAAPPEPHHTAIELGTLNSRVTHGQSFGARSLLVSARAWYPQALNDTIEFGEIGFDPRFADVYVKGVLASSPTTLVSAHLLLARDAVQFRETDGNETVDSRNGSDQVWLRAFHSWSPHVLSETVLSAGHLARSRDGISEPEDDPVVVDDERSVDFFGLKQDFTWTTSPTNVLKGGFEIRPLEAEYEYRSGAPGAETTLRLDPSATSSAAYLADRHSFGESFAAEFGLRWDRQPYTDEQQVSPRLHALWRPGADSEFRLGLGRFVQSQRIHELHVEDGETSFQRAELSRQAELTYVQRLGAGLLFRVDGYVRELTHVQPRWENLFNPVELFPETEADRVLVAPERADLRGIELLLQGASGRSLEWWASYAWSSAEDEIDGDRVPRSWDQTHAAKFLLAYHGSRGWAASLSGTLHTGWPTTPVSGEVVSLPDGSTTIEPVVGARNSTRFDTYARFDAKVSRSLGVRHGRLRFELDVLNVTDRDNACCVSDFVFETRPDGSVETTAELNSWLGITPSFSVLWEF